MQDDAPVFLIAAVISGIAAIYEMLRLGGVLGVSVVPPKNSQDSPQLCVSALARARASRESAHTRARARPARDPRALEYLAVALWRVARAVVSAPHAPQRRSDSFFRSSPSP